MSNPTTTLIIRGRRVNSGLSFQGKPYVYGGDEPYVKPARMEVKALDPDAKLCAVDECAGRHKARGYCSTHYASLLTHGQAVMPDRRRKENR